jgi:hypothetical protein
MKEGIKNKKQKVRCRYCGKSGGRIKYYTVADDMENPKPYHPKCFKKFKLDVLQKLYLNDLDWEKAGKNNH